MFTVIVSLLASSVFVAGIVVLNWGWFEFWCLCFGIVSGLCMFVWLFVVSIFGVFGAYV